MHYRVRAGERAARPVGVAVLGLARNEVLGHNLFAFAAGVFVFGFAFVF